MNLEDELGCEGYYGFGTGYVLGRALDGGGAQALHHPENQNYCAASCVRGAACWWRHKGRVVFLVPDLTALLEGLAHDPFNPLKGPALLEEYATRTKQEWPRVVEPYIMVMAGNVEDGMLCGGGGRPKERGPFHRLPWPLKRTLSETAEDKGHVGPPE